RRWGELVGWIAGTWDPINYRSNQPPHQSPPSPPDRNHPATMLDVLPLGEEHRVLADVRRQVGDALEVSADEQVFQRRIDRPRVGHHVREQDAEHRLVQRVYLVVARADVAPERAVGTE